ncbi:MAG: hypothetical protein ABIO94_11945 [Opitutaceae bacterium]
MSQAAINIANLKAELGGIYITDTAPHTGNFDTIIAVEAGVGALVSPTITGTLSAVPLPVGVPIFGLFTSITLASGKVFAYNKV